MRPTTRPREDNFRLHGQNNNTIYNWTMWRIHVNNKMSTEILKRSKKSRKRSSSNSWLTSSTFSDRANPNEKLVYNVMNETHPGSPHLTGSMYLVYGIPRVTLRRPPSDTHLLHATGHAQSCESNSETTIQTHTTENSIETKFKDSSLSDVNINKLSHADKHKQTDSKLSFADPVKETKPLNVIVCNISDSNNEEVLSDSFSCHTKDMDSKESSLRKVPSVNNEAPAATIRNGQKLPFVSKGRVFWENLAKKKSTIIALKARNSANNGVSVVVDDDNNDRKDMLDGSDGLNNEIKGNGQSSEDHMISEDILRKQHTLLRKTKVEPKPRNSKTLWRSLADRKTEILQMRDIDSSKRNEGKAKHLWDFLFSKDKELKVLMKKKPKGNHQDDSNSKHTKQHTKEVTDIGAISRRDKEVQLINDGPMDFQAELAARVRRRKLQQEQAD